MGDELRRAALGSGRSARGVVHGRCSSIDLSAAASEVAAANSGGLFHISHGKLEWDLFSPGKSLGLHPDAAPSSASCPSSPRKAGRAEKAGGVKPAPLAGPDVAMALGGGGMQRSTSSTSLNVSGAPAGGHGPMIPNPFTIFRPQIKAASQVGSLASGAPGQLVHSAAANKLRDRVGSCPGSPHAAAANPFGMFGM